MRMRKFCLPLCASVFILLALVPSATAQTTPLPAPWITPASGTYTYNIQISINKTYPWETIYYTTDGSVPSATNGKQYAGAIPVTSTITIRAIAVDLNGPAGYTNSPIVSASYVLNLPYEAPLSRGEWAWQVGGTSGNGCLMTSGQVGTYGTLGVPAAGNSPGSRAPAAHWTDEHRNLWLFGGLTPTGYIDCAYGNDLWMYNPATKEWAWMSGSNVNLSNSSQTGVYGALGQFASGNIPGGRQGSVGWTDQNGNLWLFGGDGYDSNGTFGGLNDVWEFDVSTRQWAWMAGSRFVNQNGAYGYMHEAHAGNTPGARSFSAGWADRNGNFWLFGGLGYDATGNFGDINDLWEFNPYSRQWAWMGGSHILWHPGVYGIHLSPSPANIPGARYDASTWVDAGGNFWMFGGSGMGAGTTKGDLNDLWEFNPNDLNWTWAAGNSYAGTYFSPAGYGQAGVYDNVGIPDPGNTPGSRTQATSWTDAHGNLWLFGGQGFDSNGNEGGLNDLWEFDRTRWLWAWMGGSEIAQGPDGGVTYGPYRNPSTQTQPGATANAAGWTDTNGNLWQFGGYRAGNPHALLNDMFEYMAP